MGRWGEREKGKFFVRPPIPPSPVSLSPRLPFSRLVDSMAALAYSLYRSTNRKEYTNDTKKKTDR
jgi:hypothetical protein